MTMKQFILSVLVLILAGCTTGQYQPFRSGVGHKAEQMNENTYYVTYTGSQKSEIEKVNDFALLRSAELTLEKGFDYFVITEAMNNKVALMGEQQSLASYRDWGPGDNGPVAGRGTLTGPRAKSEMTIVLFHDKPDGITYDAKQVELALKNEYQIDNSK